MSSSGYGYTAAPRSVDVLPSHVSRRLSRRDGLLPMLLALELAVGVAFGVAGASGATSVPASSAPAHVLLGGAPLVTVLPSTRPVAVVNELPVAGPPAGPVVGPAIGPLVPGTVRPAVVDVPAGTVSPPVASPPPYRRHAARNPFLTLVRG